MALRPTKTARPRLLSNGLTDQSNAVMETPEQTRQLIGDLARGLGAYARRGSMSEHDHRLALEAQIRRETAQRP